MTKQRRSWDRGDRRRGYAMHIHNGTVARLTRSERLAIEAEHERFNWGDRGEFFRTVHGAIVVRESYACSALDPAYGHVIYAPPPVRVKRGRRSTPHTGT